MAEGHDANFFFKLDRRRVLATLRVSNRAGGVEEAVRAYCAAEGIPPQTSVHLRAVAWALESEGNERGPQLRDAFDAIPSTVEEASRLAEKVWREKALKPRVSSSQDAVFSNAYRISLKHEKLLEDMIHMEHMYAAALFQLVKAQESTENVDYAQEYEAEIAQTKCDQRHGYQEFVVAQAQEIANKAADPPPLQEDTLCSSADNAVIRADGLAPYGRRVWANRDTFLQRFHEPAVIIDGTYRLFLKNENGRDAIGRRQDKAFTRKKTGSRKESTAMCSLRICLGQQHKLAYEVMLEELNTFAGTFCFPTNDSAFECRREHALRLYSAKGLRGLVFQLNEWGGLSDGLKYCCYQTTEMHFAIIEEQFQHALKRHYGQSATLRGEGNTSVLPAGEVLITRHSNLRGIHVIFHAVPVDLEVFETDASGVYQARPLRANPTWEKEQKALPTPDASTIKATMTRVLEAVIHYANIGGIQSLAIPIDLFAQPVARVLHETRTALLRVIAEHGDGRADLTELLFLQLDVHHDPSTVVPTFLEFFHHDKY